MSYHNLTLLLSSMAAAASPSNHSLARGALSQMGQTRSQLLNALQRLNQTFHPNLSESELMGILFNQSGHGEFDPRGLPSSPDEEDNYVDSSQEGMSLWLTVALYVVYAVICVLGVFGNALVCYAVAHNPSMHSVTNVFIANLAISDILLCLFCVPFTPLYLLTFKSWVFGTVLCHLLPFAQGVSIYISAFTLMSISVDRYFVILYPFRPRMQMRRCVLIIVSIWLITSILTLPYALYMELLEVRSDDKLVFYCDERWPAEGTRKIFSTCTTILQFVFPFTIITFCYVRVCGRLWDRAKTIPGSVSARREEQERERTRRTNGMLISMVLIFVVSWLPLNSYNLIMDFYIEANEWQYQGTIFLFAHCAAMSSSCYNCFLYAWLNDNFRKEFKEILPCCGKLKRSIFSSTLVELRQQTSKGASCQNLSKRNVTLNFTEQDKPNCNSFGGEKTTMACSEDAAGAANQTEFVRQCVNRADDLTSTLNISDGSSSGQVANQ